MAARSVNMLFLIGFIKST